MNEPEKPFACTLPDCGMTFTNEDHLHVHTKKHDMILQLGLEQKSAFAADQTPTPTRFIRNCEEVGLFQDLQNVNPFDEGFKKAMESKSGVLSLESTATSSSSDDVLHTPQMVYPSVDAGDSVYSTKNNHSNIIISRSSSDESGTIKEYETTTISKQTNEVTTISRVIGKPEVLDKITTDDISIVQHQETQNNEKVSYTNNVVKIHSNVQIRKDNIVNKDSKLPFTVNLISADSVIKDTNVTSKDLENRLIEANIPMMSQKSIDYVVDSLTAECQGDATKEPVTVIKSVVNNQNIVEINSKSKTKNDDYEVIIKLPNGKRMKMKPVEEVNDTGQVDDDTKKKLKKVISEKKGKKAADNLKVPNDTQKVPNVLPIPGATLYPVAIVHPAKTIFVTSRPKVPIPLLPTTKVDFEKKKNIVKKEVKREVNSEKLGFLEIRSAASKRYRERLKMKMATQENEVKRLQEMNNILLNENNSLKKSIQEHLKICKNSENLSKVKL